MKLEKIERLLVLLKQHGVMHYKTLEIEISINCDQVSHSILQTQPESVQTRSASAAPPVEMVIPHHVNEVANLLKLKDEQLVDRLFPDYTQQDEAPE